jgi:hypothetical protein
MAARNDITGDSLISVPTKAYQDNFDIIFRKPKEQPAHEFELCKSCGEIECDCEK